MMVRGGKGRASLVLLAWVAGLLGSACEPESGEDDQGEDASMDDAPSSSTGADAPSSSTDSSSSSEGSTSDADTSADTEEESSTGDPPPDADYEEPGPYPVGHTRIEIDDATGLRVLPVEIWYPADPAAAKAAEIGMPLEEFEPPGIQRNQLALLVADAPADCTRTRTRSAAGAVPEQAVAPYPLVVFSHCHQCVRFSSFSIAERLASHGFAVAGVDHVDNTLFDGLLGLGVPVSDLFLGVRASDVGRVLDVLLDPEAEELPAELVGRFDVTRVGAMGHSFGAATVGRVLKDDDRVDAGLVIAAPVESLILPGSPIAEIDEPMMLMLAQEDNAITELGNEFIRSNFADAHPPVWLVEFADAGHWSFSDVCGLVPEFTPGCGEGVRQTEPGTPFTYLDNELARDIAATYAARFFAAQLRDEAEADAALDVANPAEIVTVSVRRE